MKDELVQTDPILAKAIRRINRLREGKRHFTNLNVFEMLYGHYVEGKSKEKIVATYAAQEREGSLIMKILATNEGEESSRRPDVRRIFFEYCEEAGIHVTRGKCEGKGKGKGTHPASREGIRPLLEGFE